MALSLFLLAKEASAFLLTALFVALRPPFVIRRNRCIQAFLLKPAPFCKLFANLCSTNKSVTSLSFSPLNSRSVLATLSSPPSFLLSYTLWLIWQELFSLSLYCYVTMGPRSLLPGNDWGDLLQPSTVPFSLFLPVVSIHLFSRSGSALSH